jgi:hypothetical protein
MAAPTNEIASVKLLSHASVKITAAKTAILTDPWFFGRVFNNGWGLSPEPTLDDLKKDLANVTHIWISHEHPDHLHFPSLKFLCDEVGLANIQVLFQETNSEKVFDELQKIGYTRFLPLSHLKATTISESIDIISYGHRQLDSCLGIRVKGRNWIFNINDTELNVNDCKIIREKFGKFPILLNQYSIAGYDGINNDEKINYKKDAVISKMLSHQKYLSGDFTIPFASLMYFCKPDNSVFNAYRNTVFDAQKAFDSEGLKLLPLEPQGTALIWDINNFSPTNVDSINRESTAFFKNYYKTEGLKIDAPDEVIEFDVIKQVAEDRIKFWQRRTFNFIMKKMSILDFWVEDLKIGIRINFHTVSVEKISASLETVHIVINSQPLHFAFSTPFGFQSLGVSCRYRFASQIKEIPMQWKLVRIVSSLANADLFLNWRTFYNSSMIKWAWSRRKGLLGQLTQQSKRFLNSDVKSYN